MNEDEICPVCDNGLDKIHNGLLYCVTCYNWFET